MFSRYRFQLHTFATPTITATAYDAVVVNADVRVGFGPCLFSLVSPDTLILFSFLVPFLLLLLGFDSVWVWRLRLDRQEMTIGQIDGISGTICMGIRRLLLLMSTRRGGFLDWLFGETEYDIIERLERWSSAECNNRE